MAPRRIVLGFNDSSEARDAQQLAAGLARIADAEVIAASAFELPLLPLTLLDPEPGQFPGTEALLPEVSDEMPGVRVRAVAVASSSPARALHDLASGEEADLIVIGSSHRGAMGRVFPGSVGDRLLHGAPCAVAVAPRGYARGEHFGFGLVGVGFDGRPEAQRAVAVARRMAADLDATLRIIAAFPPPVRQSDRAEQRERLQGQLDEAAVFARQPDAGGRVVEVETVLRDGDPAEVLADAAIELDLLLVGSRGYGAIRRTMLGGVGCQVIRTSPCPVIVVPRTDGASVADSRNFKRLLAIG